MKKTTQLVAALVATCVMCLGPHRAAAFCGFYVSGASASLYNNATMVVMMREGTKTVLSMQNNYQGPPRDFAMVVPVPVVLQKENVKTLPREIFQRIDSLAAPRLVEYWEQDPCLQPVVEENMFLPSAAAAPARMRGAARSSDDLGVTVEAQFKVAEYDIVILSAKDSNGLDTWLRREKYNIPKGAESVLRPYVAKGTKFFVAKVDATKVKFEAGKAVLSPLRFHYESKDFSLPVRLGLLNSRGEQDLIVHILARGQRYEVANYENVTIPTNIRVRDQVRQNFGDFYEKLFAATVDKNPGRVVTEYSWDASSCDPCPTPALNPQEITTLGADVLTEPQAQVATGAGREPVMRRRFRPRNLFGFVLTRLHYRYGKDGLKDDLVFRAAPPVVGGRGTPNREGVFEERVQPASINNFQGRYAILHRWAGKVECSDPRRGIWGGPPGKPIVRPLAAPNPNLQLAKPPAKPFAKTVHLGMLVEDAIPQIGLKPGAAPGRSSTRPATADPTPVPESSPSDAGSSGCSVDASLPRFWWAVWACLLCALWAERRRRPV